MSKRNRNRIAPPPLRQAPPTACRLPLSQGATLVKVYVEGYVDVAFWRGIFDSYEDDRLRFEISVPDRHDLAKGKRALLDQAHEYSPYRIACVDSDFDYLFGDTTPDSRLVNGSPYLFHTYAYSTENYVCYGPSLHGVCVKATKNDTRIFDFEDFLARYSEAIYPLFLWYAFSARRSTQHFFPLIDFKSSAKINYLEVDDCGESTIIWLKRQVHRRMESLHRHHAGLEDELAHFERQIAARGLTPRNVYMYMQGHTLLDNVVMVMLHTVCDQLQLLSGRTIERSSKQGVALHNERSSYNNALRPVREVLLDNENFKTSPPFLQLKGDLDRYVAELRK